MHRKGEVERQRERERERTRWWYSSFEPQTYHLTRMHFLTHFCLMRESPQFPSSHSSSFFKPSFPGRETPLRRTRKSCCQDRLSIRGKIYTPRDSSPIFPVREAIAADGVEGIEPSWCNKVWCEVCTPKSKRSAENPRRAVFVTMETC